MRSAARRASDVSVGGWTVQVLLIATISCSLLWLVWVYGNGLRDPRYLDGWVLAVGMGVQVYFHIAIKRASLTPKSAMRWRKIHIFLGYVLIAAFLSHSNFSLPDSAFEWALWAGFVMVTLSGILGTYLSWSLQTRHRLDESISYDRIPDRRAELGQEVRALIDDTEQAPMLLALPAPPDDAWIIDLYTTHLRNYFDGQRNVAAHLIGSKRPLKRLIDEIDSLSQYVGPQGQEKLSAIKNLVVEKDRLDFARIYLGLTKGWLFVHVPVTYSLIVLAVAHVLVVYAFSSGFW
jgi:hypothetical protein